MAAKQAVILNVACLKSWRDNHNPAWFDMISIPADINLQRDITLLPSKPHCLLPSTASYWDQLSFVMSDIAAYHNSYFRHCNPLHNLHITELPIIAQQPVDNLTLRNQSTWNPNMPSKQCVLRHCVHHTSC